MTATDRILQKAEAGKEAGNARFKAKEWEAAFTEFSGAIDLLLAADERDHASREAITEEVEDASLDMKSVREAVPSPSVSEKVYDERRELLAKCYLNRAMTSHRLSALEALGNKQLGWLWKGVEDCSGAIGLKAGYTKALLKKAGIFRELLHLGALDGDADVPKKLEMYSDVMTTLDECEELAIDFDMNKATDSRLKTVAAMQGAIARLIEDLSSRDGGGAPPPSRKTIKVSFSSSSSSTSSYSSSSSSSLSPKKQSSSNCGEAALSAPSTPSEGIKQTRSEDKRRADILKLIRQDKFEEENMTEAHVGSCRFLVHLKWWSELMSSLLPPEADTETGGQRVADTAAKRGAAAADIGEVNNWRLLLSAVKLKKLGKSNSKHPPPPPGTNGGDDKSRLVHEQLDGYRLKEDREEGKHYKSVAKDTWDAIQGLYGGGPALPRFVRERPGSPKSYFLDIRPDLPFSADEMGLVGPYLKRTDDNNEMAMVRGGTHQATYPPNDCGATVMQAPSKKKADREKEKEKENREDASEESEESRVTYVNSCFVCGDPAGHHCAKCSAVHYCSRDCQASHWKFHKSWCKQAGDSRDLRRVDFCKVVNVGRRGHVGIQNLGNSCYLNSILQCMSHLKPLTSFFLCNAYESQLNLEAVFGTKGKMVSEYVSLLQDLWFGDRKVISPKTFKSFLGRVNDAWAGSSQQDSEEVLNFVLDKLHEDLNRVKKKPYVEKGDGDGTNCVEVAAEEWKKGFLRDDSIVKDVMGGLHRSRLRCPECGKESVTFDYFSTVPLELKTPSSTSPGATVPVSLKVIYFPSKERSFPLAFMLHMRRSQTMQDLEDEVRKLVHSTNGESKADDAVQCYRMSEDERSIKSVLSGDNPEITRLAKKNFPETHTIAAYPCTKEVRSTFSQSVSSKTVNGGLIHRRVSVSNIDDNGKAVTIQTERVGLPWLTTFQTSHTCLKLRTLFWRQIVKFFKRDSPVITTLNRLKEAGDVMAEIAFHKKMASLLPLRFTTSTGNGKTRHIGKSKEIVKLTSLSSNEESFREEDKAYIDGNAEDLGAPLPCDETTTIADFFGSDDQVQGYPFFAMDWVRGGYFEEQLQEELLVKVNQHSSIDSYQQALPFKARGATGRRPGGAFDLTIEQCFDEYTKDEINRDLTWKCSGCKKEQSAPQKKIDFLAGYLPNVLIVHLKRFAHRNLEIYSGGRTFGHQQKIDMYVDFPLEGLDLAPYCTRNSLAASGSSEDDCLYDLFAVCNHYGRMGFGHYTAFARDWLPDGDLEDQWFSYDDDSVVPVSSTEEVQSNAAYVLFYRRRTSPQKR